MLHRIHLVNICKGDALKDTCLTDLGHPSTPSYPGLELLEVHVPHTHFPEVGAVQ